MARGKNPGDDFDNQFNASRRKGQERASRGEGPWHHDKYLRDLKGGGEGHQAPPGDNGGCGKDAAILLGFLGGLAWFLGETAGRIL